MDASNRDCTCVVDTRGKRAELVDETGELDEFGNRRRRQCQLRNTPSQSQKHSIWKIYSKQQWTLLETGLSFPIPIPIPIPHG